MSEIGALDQEIADFRETLDNVNSGMDESDPEVIALRDAAATLVRGIEAESAQVEQLTNRAYRSIGPPVEEDLLDRLGEFITAGTSLYTTRSVLYAAGRAIHDDHTRIDDINAVAIADSALDREITYRETGEDIESDIATAESAYDEGSGTDFNDPQRAAPQPAGSRMELYPDPHNAGLLSVSDEALYTLYLDNAGESHSSDLRIVASFDELEHFDAGFLSSIPDQAVTLDSTADLGSNTDDGGDGANGAGSDNSGVETLKITSDSTTSTPERDTDSENEDPTEDADKEGSVDEISVDDTEQTLQFGSIDPNSGRVFGIYTTPFETGTDLVHIGVQRQGDGGEWTTITDQSISLQAVTSAERDEIAAEILDPTEEGRPSEEAEEPDNDEGDEDGAPVAEAAVLGGAGVLTAGGYLAYRRLQQGSEDE